MDKMKLLAGLPIEIKDVGWVHPFKLREIAEIGQQNFFQMISLLTFDPDDLGDFKSLKTADGKPIDIETYDVLLMQMLFSEDEGLKKNILDALSRMFREPVRFSDDPGFFYLGEIREERFILKKQYSRIKKIIKVQNGLQKSSEKIEEQYKPSNDEAKRIFEKLKAGRKAVQKQREKDGGGTLYIEDLISIVAAKSNSVNLISVWDYTMFQLNDAFARLRLIDEYDLSIGSLLAGADSKKIQLKHWMSKIED